MTVLPERFRGTPLGDALAQQAELERYAAACRAPRSAGGLAELLIHPRSLAQRWTYSDGARPEQLADFLENPSVCRVSDCFANATLAALAYDVQYVEGFAWPGSGIEMPVHHAWNLLPDGTVVDCTWCSHGIKSAGEEYIGFVVPREIVWDWVRRETPPGLFNWRKPDELAQYLSTPPAWMWSTPNTAGARARIMGRKIAIRNSARRGRGVFALQPIARGELIEVAPVLRIPDRDRPKIRDTFLKHYVYEDAMPLGFAMVYNHSYSPNAVYREDGDVWRVIARRPIAAGEEVTVNYNADPNDRSPLWFKSIEAGARRPEWPSYSAIREGLLPHQRHVDPMRLARIAHTADPDLDVTRDARGNVPEAELDRLNPSHWAEPHQFLYRLPCQQALLCAMVAVQRAWDLERDRVVAAASAAEAPYMQSSLDTHSLPAFRARVEREIDMLLALGWRAADEGPSAVDTRMLEGLRLIPEHLLLTLQLGFNSLAALVRLGTGLISWVQNDTPDATFANMIEAGWVVRCPYQFGEAASYALAAIAGIPSRDYRFGYLGAGPASAHAEYARAFEEWWTECRARLAFRDAPTAELGDSPPETVSGHDRGPFRRLPAAEKAGFFIAPAMPAAIVQAIRRIGRRLRPVECAGIGCSEAAADFFNRLDQDLSASIPMVLREGTYLGTHREYPGTPHSALPFDAVHRWLEIDGHIFDPTAGQWSDYPRMAVEHYLPREVIWTRGPVEDRRPVSSPQSGVEVPDSVDQWIAGGCHALALALHEATAWPILILVQCAGYGGGVCHAGVRRPDGAFVDALGVHDMDAVAARWRPAEVREISPAALKRRSRGLGLSPLSAKMLTAARSYVAAHPELTVNPEAGTAGTRDPEEYARLREGLHRARRTVVPTPEQRRPPLQPSLPFGPWHTPWLAFTGPPGVLEPPPDEWCTGPQVRMILEALPPERMLFALGVFWQVWIGEMLTTAHSVQPDELWAGLVQHADQLFPEYPGGEALTAQQRAFVQAVANWPVQSHDGWLDAFGETIRLWMRLRGQSLSPGSMSVRRASGEVVQIIFALIRLTARNFEIEGDEAQMEFRCRLLSRWWNELQRRFALRGAARFRRRPTPASAESLRARLQELLVGSNAPPNWVLVVAAQELVRRALPRIDELVAQLGEPASQQTRAAVEWMREFGRVFVAMDPRTPDALQRSVLADLAQRFAEPARMDAIRLIQRGYESLDAALDAVYQAWLVVRAELGLYRPPRGSVFVAGGSDTDTVARGVERWLESFEPLAQLQEGRPVRGNTSVWRTRLIRSGRARGPSEETANRVRDWWVAVFDRVAAIEPGAVVF